MPLKADEIVRRMCLPDEDGEALAVVPGPGTEADLAKFSQSGDAAIDLRLGRWLLSLRESRATILEIQEDDRKVLSLVAEGYRKMHSYVQASQEGKEKESLSKILEECFPSVDIRKLAHSMYLEELEKESNSPKRLERYHFVPFGNRFVLHPGQFLLGITFEWLKFPNDLAGFVTGKSSWGRRGLIIETAAGIHPGFCGCLTLEIGNVGPVPIPLIPGMRICQVFFENAHGDKSGAKSQFDGRRRPVIGDIRFDKILDRLRQPI